MSPVDGFMEFLHGGSLVVSDQNISEGQVALACLLPQGLIG